MCVCVCVCWAWQSECPSHALIFILTAAIGNLSSKDKVVATVEGQFVKLAAVRKC